ncbi:MAG: hypothetical protein ACFNVT_12745 [Corynebacterium matruchotii]
MRRHASLLSGKWYPFGGFPGQHRAARRPSGWASGQSPVDPTATETHPTYPAHRAASPAPGCNPQPTRESSGRYHEQWFPKQSTGSTKPTAGSSRSTKIHG